MKFTGAVLFGVFVMFAFTLPACRGETTAPTDAPVKCERDTDCSAPPCGPCASGSTISVSDMQRECVVNSCTAGGKPAPVAYCNNRVCTIR